MVQSVEGLNGEARFASGLIDPKTLSDHQLLAALLVETPSQEEKEPSSQDLADQLLEEYGGFMGLAKAYGEFHRYTSLRSLSPLTAAFEIACRIAKEKVSERELLDRPGAVARYLALRYGLPDQEVMGALFLDVRNRLIFEGEMFRGTLTGASVEPRVILKKALLCSAAGVVLFHCHPSGDPTPSQEDLAFTERMVDAGRLIGIRIIDHLVLGAHDRWVSLARLGFIDLEK